MRQTALLRRIQLPQTLTPKPLLSTTLPIFSPFGRRRGVVGIAEGDEVVGERTSGGNRRFGRNRPAWRIDIDFSTNTKFGRNFQACRLSTLPEDSRSYYSVAKDLRSCGTTSSVANSNYSCSIFRNFLLSFPVCVSADDCGNRLFLSDSNNHRIIVASDKGEILDCIGSSAGFEDGGFESAELLRPAGSIYCADEDCLYFADSENHAIRRADLENRVVETIHPPVSNNKTKLVWSWIMNKIGMKGKTQADEEKSDFPLFMFPWHLVQINKDDVLVIDRSFESSWILSMASGQIKHVIRGFPNLMEEHGEVIRQKISPLKKLIENGLQQKFDAGISVEGLPYVGLLSTAVDFKGSIIYCDTVFQTVMIYDPVSKYAKNVQFSNLEVLGMPHWLHCPIERVLSRDGHGEDGNDYRQQFSLLPGRCHIWVNVDIPEGFELAAPVTEDSIWRQARGSATEVTEASAAESSEKVGAAQQWYDELDNLALMEMDLEPNKQQQDALQDTKYKDDDKVHMECDVNTSPGTSEIIISTVLYLKLKASNNCNDRSVRGDALKLLKLFKMREDDVYGNLLLQSERDLNGLVFLKPLNVRIRLECANHPLCPKSREIISTNSTVEVNISP